VDVATVSVAVVASRTEAELIAGMLRSHGVSAAVSADDAGGQYPQMQVEGVRVLVAPRMKPRPVGSSPSPAMLRLQAERTGASECTPSPRSSPSQPQAASVVLPVHQEFA
jgi:hypothetical protein